VIPLETDIEPIIAMHPNGKMLATTQCISNPGGFCENSEIALWDISDAGNPSQLKTFSTNSTEISCLDFSPDGRLLVMGSKDQTVKLWDINDPSNPVLLSNFSANHGAISNLAFTPDSNMLATGNEDKTIALWNISVPDTPKLGLSLPGHSEPITALSFNTDGRVLVSASEDKALIIWDIQNAQRHSESTILSNPQVPVSSIAFSPRDNKLLAAGYGDGTVLIWNPNESGSISVQSKSKPAEEFGTAITSLAFSLAGDMLITGSQNNKINFWDIGQLPKITKLSQLPGSPAYLFALALSPDGKFLITTAAGMDSLGFINLWNIDSPQNPTQVDMQDLPSLGMELRQLVTSPTGKLFVSANVNPLFQSGQLKYGFMAFRDIHQLKSDSLDLTEVSTNNMTSMAISPDGNTLVLGSADKNIYIWDVSHLENMFLKTTLTGYGGENSHTAFSADGKLLATSGDNENSTTLWDTSTMSRLITLPGLSQSITGISFRPDSLFLASGLKDGSIIVWDISPESWLQKACEIVGRNFTRAEWTQYFPNEPYRKTCEQWPLEPAQTATTRPAP
jgi:WD40 repeat protein